MALVPEGSIDYVFTDPPFGSNIYYADCNLIWESWLGQLTEPEQEAVVNRALKVENGGKTLKAYADLIAASMTEVSRVLKPEGWATVVFHNTNSDVWQALRDAAEGAGFEFHQAASLDRGQQSHKGYKGRSESEDVAHFDVVLNLRKRRTSKRLTIKHTSRPDFVKLVSSLARDPKTARRGLQGIHAEVMRRLASNGSPVFVDYSEVRSIWNKTRPKVRAKAKR